MTYLRFTRAEYRAIVAVWVALHLERPTPHAFKRLLAELVRDALPDLARRIAGLRSRELRILCDHLRGRPPVRAAHDLTADEMVLVGQVADRLPHQSRFVQPLRRFLVKHFHNEHPALAQKLDRMSLRQFEALCRQVR